MHPRPMTPTSGPLPPSVVVRMLGPLLAAVFLVGHEVAPLGFRPLTLTGTLPHGEVGHEVVGSSAVPVPPLPRAGVEGLPDGVAMPRVAGAGREADDVEADAAGLLALGDDVVPDVASEDLGRAFDAWLLGLDFRLSPAVPDGVAAWPSRSPPGQDRTGAHARPRQPQRTGERFQHPLRDPTEVPPLKAGVVFDAHTGQQRGLLPPESGHAPVAAVSGQACLLRRDPGARGGQELANLVPVVHHHDATSAHSRVRGPVSTWIDRDSLTGVVPCLLAVAQLRGSNRPPFAGSARAFSIRRTERSLVRATVMYGAGDVRVENVSDPTLQGTHRSRGARAALAIGRRLVSVTDAKALAFPGPGGNRLGHRRADGPRRRPDGARRQPMGALYRETTPEMLTRATAAIEDRLAIALKVAARLLPEVEERRRAAGTKGRFVAGSIPELRQMPSRPNARVPVVAPCPVDPWAVLRCPAQPKQAGVMQGQ